MVELTCGHKRRRSDAEENERIALRQMVFNMSMCKLGKDIGRKEPSLRRSVMITNTVRLIEHEMDQEMFAKYNHDIFYHDHCDHIQQNIAEDINNNAITLQSEHDNLSNTVLNIKDNEHKFGVIGDHRKCPTAKEIEKFRKLDLGNFLESGVGESTPTIENVVLEEKFDDVDITLYDFDYPSKPILLMDWRVYPTNSCAMEFEVNKPNAFFEELDQIMQVLVGM